MFGEDWFALVRSLLVLVPAFVAVFLAILRLKDHDTPWVRRLGNFGLILFCLYITGEVGNALWNRTAESEKRRSIPRYVPPVSDTSLAEASGGSAMSSPNNDNKEYAVIVDDERAALFRLEFDPQARRYRNATWSPIVVDGESPADLEATAIYKSGIYVITSHSNTKKGERKPEREWLIKLEYAPNKDAAAVVQSTSDLRDGIEGYFANNLSLTTPWRNKDDKKEVMNIEGLAIDSTGSAYLGFRSPLMGNKALILQAPIDSLLAGGTVPWQHILLDLAYSGDESNDPHGYRQHIDNIGHGIVALEYDPYSDRILVLSNAQHREEWLVPVLWSFKAEPARGQTIRPDKCDAGESDVTGVGKPEALLVHPVDYGGWGLSSITELFYGGRNGRISLFYDVGDRPSLYRVLDRYDLCPEVLASRPAPTMESNL